MSRQRPRFPSYSGPPPPYQSTNNPPPPDVNGTRERDPLLPHFQPNNGTTNTAPQGLTRKPELPQQPSFKTILLLTFVLGVSLGTLLKHATSTSIFDPAVRDQIRRQWDSERLSWEKVREEEARRRQQREAEEEQRQRAEIHWLALERSERCQQYGTRKYQAKLGPIVNGYDPMKACWTTEMEIHGRKMKPTFCEDKGRYHGVWGNWIVNFDEGGCRTFWEGFTDKGCTAPGSGLRRFDAHLINLDYTDSWNIMCSSTPADFNGLHFNGAMSCINGMFGVFGIWDVDDANCR